MPVPALLGLIGALLADHDQSTVQRHAERTLLQLAFSSDAQVLSSPAQLTVWAQAHGADPRVLVRTLHTTGHPKSRIRAIAVATARAKHLPPHAWSDIVGDATLEVVSRPLQELTWDQLIRYLRRAATQQSKTYERETPFPVQVISNRAPTVEGAEAELVRAEEEGRLKGVNPQDRELLELYIIDRESLYDLAERHWHGDVMSLVDHLSTVAPSSTLLRWTQRFLQTQGAVRSPTDHRPVLSPRQHQIMDLVYVERKTLDEAADIVPFKLSDDTHARRLGILKLSLRQAQINLLRHLDLTVPAKMSPKKRPSAVPLTDKHRLAYDLLSQGLSSKEVGERVQPEIPPKARAPAGLAKKWRDAHGLPWPPFETKAVEQDQERDSGPLDLTHGAEIYRYRQWGAPWYELQDLYGSRAQQIAEQWALREGKAWPPPKKRS